MYEVMRVLVLDRGGTEKNRGKELDADNSG